MKLFRLTPEQTEALGRHLARAADMWRQLLEAFRQMARQLTRVTTLFAEYVPHLAKTYPTVFATARPLPAWMSPYGPPTRRRR